MAAPAMAQRYHPYPLRQQSRVLFPCKQHAAMLLTTSREA
jgi:hypothetical protein